MKPQQAYRGRYSATCGTWSLHNAGFGSFKEILAEIVALNKEYNEPQVTTVNERIIRRFLKRRAALKKESNLPTITADLSKKIRAIAFIIASNGGSHAIYIHEGVILDSREPVGFTLENFPDQFVYHLFVLA